MALISVIKTVTTLLDHTSVAVTRVMDLVKMNCIVKVSLDMFRIVYVFFNLRIDSQKNFPMVYTIIVLQ